jgi:hypothetical protein
MPRHEIPTIEESMRVLIDNRNLLQKTAREQDILDGGNGEVVHVFTIQDAKELPWIENVAPRKDIRHLFSGKR